ncbi:MAG: MATE family efflux transporter [Spirochaetaceae bacterium]
MINLKEIIQNKKALLFMIITMSLPAIMEMFLNTMLGVADTIMISRFIGKEALASVGFANQIVYTLIFIFSAFNTGAVALISRALGEKNYKKLEAIAEQNITLNLIIGIIILALGYIFSNSIFKIFDISDKVYNDAISYFKIIMIGFVPMFLCFSFAATLRGSGNTVTPMVITGVSNIINIIGNFVLILGIGPFPELGIEGAAWSTSGSRMIALLLYVFVIYIKKSNIRLKMKFFFNKDILKPLWKISLPGGIEQALMHISFVVMAVIVSKLDTVAEATFRILIQIESLSFMPAVGMSIATATLVGKSLGEQDPDKASEVGFLSAGMGVFWGIFIGTIFIIFPNQIIGIFTKDSVVINTGAPVMLFMGLNQMWLTFTIVISGALRGAGDTKYVMTNTLLRLWIIFIPLSFLFVNILNLGIVGVWYAEIASFFFFAALLFFRFKSRKWVKELV